MKIIVSLALALLVSGCTSSGGTSEQTAAAAKARKNCRSEAQMGSIRRVTRCRSQAEIDAEGAANREAWRNRTTVSGGGSSIESQ